jgi:hypothetical protein
MRRRQMRDAWADAADQAPVERPRFEARALHVHATAADNLDRAQRALSRASTNLFASEGKEVRDEVTDLMAHVTLKTSQEDATPEQRLARQIFDKPSLAFARYRAQLVQTLVKKQVAAAAGRKTTRDKKLIPLVFTSLGHMGSTKALKTLGGGPSGEDVVRISCLFLRSEFAILRRMDRLMNGASRHRSEDGSES